MKFVPIKVEVDEISLSLLGWEAVNLQARLMTEHLGPHSYLNMVTAAGELRFHPDDWRDRYNATNLSMSEYLPPLVWQLRSAAHGPLMSYQTLGLGRKAKELRAPKMISESTDKWESTVRPNPDDQSIWVTAMDWDEIDGWHSRPSSRWADLPVEVLDQTTKRGIRTETRELTARIRANVDLEVSLRAQFALGSADELLAAAIDSDDYFGDLSAPIAEQEDFVVQAPDVTVCTYDEVGFLLENRTLSNYRWVTVHKGGSVPRRGPSLVAVVTAKLDDLAGAPARVVVRVTDPVA
ncbi:hypothetical protein GCM10009827_109580 [Dactylosporangium maewongense]|uniref:Uncharacterized protein n=1 Tax=Dactylosporangium maewongense TaxID=634393 RepID=A0ABP4NZA5_9ACTN